jgi:hypothetical protein
MTRCPRAADRRPELFGGGHLGLERGIGIFAGVQYRG